MIFSRSNWLRTIASYCYSIAVSYFLIEGILHVAEEHVFGQEFRFHEHIVFGGMIPFGIFLIKTHVFCCGLPILVGIIHAKHRHDAHGHCVVNQEKLMQQIEQTEQDVRLKKKLRKQVVQNLKAWRLKS